MKSTASGLTSYGNFFEQIWWLRPPLGQKGGLRPASARRDGSSRQSRRRRGAGATGSKTGRAFRWMGTLVVLCVVAKLLIFSAEKQTQLREEEEEEDDCAGRMAARLELVNRVCADDPRAAPLRRGGRDDNYPIPHFFRSNAHHRATVCTPHKCGSESWRCVKTGSWKSAVIRSCIKINVSICDFFLYQYLDQLKTHPGTSLSGWTSGIATAASGAAPC